MATITYGETAVVDRAGRIGGMTSGELLRACREIASAVELVGHEIVEVLPDRIGSRDITALVAERVVRETLTGVALARVREPART